MATKKTKTKQTVANANSDVLLEKRREYARRYYAKKREAALMSRVTEAEQKSRKPTPPPPLPQQRKPNPVAVAKPILATSEANLSKSVVVDVLRSLALAEQNQSAVDAYRIAVSLVRRLPE